jgi:RNA polymerase sigma factor (sigma-70 family)
MKITQNTAYNHLKSERLRQGDDPESFFALSDDFDAISHTETTVMLEGAMAGLSDKEKQAVYQKYYLDLTVREIAERMGISKSEAARKVKSGEEKIKAYLLAHGYDGK